MFGRKRREDDEIGPSKGIMKWLNRFLRFVLYPVMHPFKFFVILVVVIIVLVGVPSYLGVTFDNIGTWYGDKLEAGYEWAKAWSAEHLWSKVVQNGSSVSEDASLGQKTAVDETKTTKADLVAYEAPKAYERRVFSQEQNEPVDVAATPEQEPDTDTDTVIAPSITTENAPQDTGQVSENDRPARPAKPIVFKRNDALDLAYLDEPQELRGVARVVNANELRIGHTYVLLYGIYVEPKSFLGRQAARYLELTFAGKEVYCQIGAYTSEKTATAICFCDGVNINQKLVDLAYSKDVSLN
jgi:hypothetical protein